MREPFPNIEYCNLQLHFLEGIDASIFKFNGFRRKRWRYTLGLFQSSTTFYNEGGPCSFPNKVKLKKGHFIQIKEPFKKILWNQNGEKLMGFNQGT